jgi:hypothetical protein
MSRLTKCDICGQISSESYLRSHKRLAHRTTASHSLRSAQTEPETVKAILALYGQLSQENQHLIRSYLLAGSTAGSEIN